MMRVEPLQQRTAGVQADLERLVRLEDIEKRQVAVLIRLLEDVVEVADRLVIVADENQADGVRHGGQSLARGKGLRGGRDV